MILPQQTISRKTGISPKFPSENRKRPRWRARAGGRFDADRFGDLAQFEHLLFPNVAYFVLQFGAS